VSSSHANPLTILQIAGAARAGGGEQVALRLHQAYGARGHRSWLGLGSSEHEAGPGEILIPDRWHVGAWPRWLDRARRAVVRLAGGRGQAKLLPLFEALAYPSAAFALFAGLEDFTQPGSHAVLSRLPSTPDILHLHNLHARWLRREGFFDLRLLADWSRRAPLVLTAHDPWLLTGHCAHPLGCPRWRVGCGLCPDLDIYPAVRRDATHANWLRKQRIYAASRLYLATPSRWLMAMFDEAGFPAVEKRVIPNGVASAVFTPGDWIAARRALGLDAKHSLVLVVANRLRTNPWKGYDWLREVAARLGADESLSVDIVCVGDEGPVQPAGNARLIFAGQVEGVQRMADYYRAADVYLHPSRADTFPLAVLEAMSSGLPVVATSVGGIPEQVAQGESGFLVRPGDVAAMATRVSELLRDAARARNMGARGRTIVEKEFRFESQVNAYLDWFAELREKRVAAAAGGRRAGRHAYRLNA
jgi:glycosyltransferase involved in cell wall biosynthesis